jgi:hypothetical protein
MDGVAAWTTSVPDASTKADMSRVLFDTVVPKAPGQAAEVHCSMKRRFGGGDVQLAEGYYQLTSSDLPTEPMIMIGEGEEVKWMPSQGFGPPSLVSREPAEVSYTMPSAIDAIWNCC